MMTINLNLLESSLKIGPKKSHKNMVILNFFCFYKKKTRSLCLEYDISFSGVGLPKNNDFSKGYCSQMAIFSRKNLDENLREEAEKTDKFYAEEISSIIYPFEQKNYQNFLKILKQQYKFTINFIKNNKIIKIFKKFY